MDDQDQTQQDQPEGALGTADVAMGYTDPNEIMPEGAPFTERQGTLQVLRDRLMERERRASEMEDTQFNAMISQIKQAKERLLTPPSQQQTLQSLSSKLLDRGTPKDPRFYEQRNLFTFLRDVGEFGSEQQAAQKKAQESAGNLEQLMAKYQYEKAKGEGSQARQLMAQYLSKDAAAAGLTNDMKEARDAGMTLKDYLAYKEDIKQKPDNIPSDLKSRMIAHRILQNPQSKPDEVAAAQSLLREKDKNISKGLTQNKKVSMDYVNRLRSQRNYTLPDIEKAIAMIDKYGSRAAGKIASDIKGFWIVGQPATDLDSLLTSIKSAIGFDKLNELKRFSAQGASGLGAVSDREQKLLASSRGSIELQQDPEQLKRALQRIKDFYSQDVDSELNKLGVTNLDDALKVVSDMPEELDYSQASDKPSGGEAPRGGGAPSGGVFNISREAIAAERERRAAGKK